MKRIKIDCKMLMITKKIAMNKEVCKITNMMITLTYMELIGQYDENKLLFWAICNVLSI